MTTTIEQLAGFVARTAADDIPESVLDYTAKVLFDCVISAMAATGLERGRMSIATRDVFGAGTECTILGAAERSSVLGAAFVNADLMNLLDADETFFNGAHFAAMSFAPALAQAEAARSSGRDLLAACALSFDVSARLNLGTSLMEYDGEDFRFSQLSSHGYAALGSASAIGRLQSFDADQLGNAMGLAAWLAPTSKNNYMSRRRRFNSLKYSPNGSIATAGILAARMAAEGFEGDADVLDTKPGFFEAQGYIGGDREAVCTDIGQKWWIEETSIKPYPACRFSHAALDAVGAYLAESGVSADDIEQVVVALGPAAYSISQFREPVRDIADDHIAPYAGQFSMPHLVAMVMAGVAPGPAWFAPETFNDPRIQALAARVTVNEDTELAEDWRATIQSGAGKKVRRTRGALTIRVGGTDESFQQEFAMGDPWSDETRMTWQRLRDKAQGFCGHLASDEQLDELLTAFRELDSLDVATDLVPLIQAVR